MELSLIPTAVFAQGTENTLSLNINGNKFTVTASGKDEGNGVVVVALYDDEKRINLLDAKIFDLSKTDDLTGVFEESGCVSATWWSDLENIMPLCKSTRINFIYDESGKRYGVMDGSTWKDFVESDNNTDKMWSIDVEGYVLCGTKYCADKDGTLITENNIIKEAYTFIDSGVYVISIRVIKDGKETWEYPLRSNVTWQEFVNSAFCYSV